MSTKNNDFVYQHAKDFNKTLKLNKLCAKGRTVAADFSIDIDAYSTKNVAKNPLFLNGVFIVKAADYG